MKTALISVSNKEGIIEFAKQLSKLGYDIISTGNTAKLLQKNKIKTTLISEITKFPEMLDGRVKSLHPNIFAGVLADLKNKKHAAELKKYKISPISIVVVNFYPFEETIKQNAKINDVIESIDIGGPSLVRAAAKNHKNVAVIVNPADYGKVLDEIKKGDITDETRKNLATKAFLHTGRYDTIIGRYFTETYLNEMFPDTYNFTFKKIQDLRYGENPHQKAAFYGSYWINETCVSTSKQLQGKELSYNNILDANDAFELVKDFDEPVAAVIKHTNPSGVSTASTIDKAYKKAYETDSKSAFGGIVALNRPCTKKIAEMLKPVFMEVVICPKFEKEAIEIFKGKKNLRLLETGPVKKDYKSMDMRKVVGGLLVQTRQFPELKEKDLKVVTKRKPTKDEIRDMLFSWKVNRHVKSNAIVFAKNNVTTGIGAGQMSRVDAVKLAIMKSEDKCKGSVMSSDAFFPFSDGVDEAAKAGITAIIQPGGSIRDGEVIKAADDNNLAMVFTGVRLFKH
ncbi:MAG: bifunctional phosphoribosylaminoimidazolecarboxamide formyltransferase/IMP cyclohydrolase [Nanoarchaeota archaeon]